MPNPCWIALARICVPHFQRIICTARYDLGPVVVPYQTTNFTAKSSNVRTSYEIFAEARKIISEITPCALSNTIPFQYVYSKFRLMKRCKSSCLGQLQQFALYIPTRLLMPCAPTLRRLRCQTPRLSAPPAYIICIIHINHFWIGNAQKTHTQCIHQIVRMS